MPLRIFNNISSANARRSLGASVGRLGGSISRIASGVRAQKSSDDSASLAISTKLRSDTRALQQALRNVDDGKVMVSIAESDLNEIASILIRMREIAAQSATATVGDSERKTLQLVFSQLSSEVDRIAGSTSFKGQKLFNGDLSATSSNPIFLQIGMDSSANSRFNLSKELDIDKVTTGTLGLTGASVSTQGGAVVTLDTVSAVVDKMSTIRTKIAAVQTRLSHATSSLSSTVGNLTQAESAVRDADLGLEIMKLTRDRILVQSGAAMTVQANLVPRNVLVLLNGF